MTGIDISGVQADDVPGDWDFIVVKISEGRSTPNPRFHAQWNNASRTTRGVYHYARPAYTDGATQAHYFADQALAAGFQPNVDIWQLDAEDGENGGVTTWRTFIIEFMTVALARLGKRGFLYAGRPFLYAHGCMDLPFHYLHWLPDYGRNDGNDHGIPNGDPVVIHQFTSVPLDQNHIVNALAYAQPGPVVVHPETVKAQFMPALNVQIAAWYYSPELATTFLAQPDGSLFCLGNHTIRGLNEDADFVGREVSRLVAPTPAEKQAGKHFAIIDTNEERYALPKVFKPLP